MRKKHQLLFEQFTATFDKNTTVGWQKLIDSWKMDRTQPNPYLETEPCKMVTINLFFKLVEQVFSNSFTRCAG